MILWGTLLIYFVIVSISDAFTNVKWRPTYQVMVNHSSETFNMVSTEENDIDLGLTPELEKITKAFGSIPDEKTRYKQLLYMAGQLPNMDPSLFVSENKVPGCLSTVYVDCSTETRDDGEVVVNYVGESDGLLTKGLVALLVRGLSGCTPDQISKVNPEFINAAKISQSLTPGRNNGFLNMLAVMKHKAEKSVTVKVDGASDTTNEDVVDTCEYITSFEEIDGKPMYNEIMRTLIKLKPAKIELIDNSDQHANHAGAKGWEESGESHFSLEIVADAFEGLSLVKRHQLIYLLLGNTMPKIHALQIKAKTPDE
mmetsp:Transcript_23332/g.32815  ORF Transcript_23332/g.32815 Transcript_23332/m.32815 type:complete len:312 (+) Transcript_23332:47-982(+)